MGREDDTAAHSTAETATAAPEGGRLENAMRRLG